VGAAERAEGRKSARHTRIRALEGELAAADVGDLRALVGAPARISGIGGGIDRGPELGGQLIHIVERQRDLLRADDPATPVLVSNSRLECSVGCWRSLPRHSARPKPTTGHRRGSHLPFGAKLHGRMHANCPLSG